MRRPGPHPVAITGNERRDPDLPFDVTALADRLRRSLADPFRWTAMLSAFALTGLMLASLGVFGLMSYVVRQRRREIGVRIALGAKPAAVTRMIVTGGMRYALLGGVIGLATALVEVRWLESLLFHVNPTDPVTILRGGVLLLLAGALACWLPGRRAAGINPLEAIRSE